MAVFTGRVTFGLWARHIATGYQSPPGLILVCMRNALVALGFVAAALSQAPPAFLAESQALEPGLWTDAQVDGWRSQAEDYLATSPAGDYREDTYRRMLEWARFRDGKTGRGPLRVANRYLAEFPAGIYADEMNWKRVYFENYSWEYEGDLGSVLDDARTFDDYLAASPDTTVADEIKLAIAWRYQAAHEIITYDPPPGSEFGAAESTAFRNRAVTLWRQVSMSHDAELARQARDFLADEWVYYGGPPRPSAPEPPPQTMMFVVTRDTDGRFVWEEATRPSRLPGVVWTENRLGVIWQSGEVLASPSAELLEHLPTVLRGATGGTGNGCEKVVAFHDRWDGARVENPATLTDMVDWAELVVEGTVVGSTGGFMSGLPGRMLEVSVDRVLKDSPDFEAETLFVFYPSGEVVVGDRRLCREAQSLPVPPQQGDRVLLFPRRLPAHSDYPIVELMTTGVEIVFGRGKAVNVPALLQQIGSLGKARRFNQIVRATSKAAGRR